MKLSIRKMVESQSALQKLSQLDLPANVSYSIFKNIKMIEKVVEPYWDARQKRLTPYSDENGIVTFPDEKIQSDISDELDEILNIEEDMKIIKLSINDFKNVNISPGVIYSLDYMFKE